MKLPLNLYMVLSKKLKAINEGTDSNITNSNKTEKVDINKSVNTDNTININNVKSDGINSNNSSKININNMINNKQINNENNFNIQICPYELYNKDKEKFRQIILEELEKVYKETSKTNQDEVIINLLYKIVGNLVTNFTEKFMKISKSSKTYTTNLGLHQSSLNFLKFIGFVDIGDFFVLSDHLKQENISNLKFYFESFMIIKSKF